jgi:hypothetical protein
MNASTYAGIAGIPGHSISMQECVTFGNRMTALTLDSVLRQTILNDVSLSGQPLIIKLLIILISIMLIIGFICDICSLIVFHNKEILKIGCAILSSYIINH